MTTSRSGPSVLTTDEHDVLTLLAALARTVAARADAPALVWYEDTGRADPDHADTGRREMTWGEYAGRAGHIAAGLRALGVRRGDHVVLLLRNRPEFYLVDTACMLIGAISVSVYLSPSVDALAHTLTSCDAAVCVMENAVFLDRVRAALARPGAARPRLVGVDTDTAAPDVTPLTDLEQHGPPVGLDDAVATAQPADPVTMLFTSGTTGDPKGVPLTHANLLFAARTLSRRMGVSLTGRPQLSYLPMAHIGERLATHYLHMVQGSTVTCCPDMATLPEVLAATAPHMLFGAPRMWERLHDQVVARLDTEPDLRDALADPRLPPAQRRRLMQGVLSEFGLAEVAVAIVGSAPLPRRVQQFWLDTGMPLADCYGQTESCGMGTWDPRDIVLGTCGRPFDGMEIRIAGDGEVLVRGPALFGGYHRNPEATASALDVDGWYHTGDLGRLDDGGNLVLTGRRDDLLVPTSGHSVHPGPIEDELRRIPVVGHAMVVGHGRPNLTAVLALDPEASAAWATEHGRAGAEPAGDAGLRAAVDAAVAAINEHRPGPERIRAHLVVDDLWPLASDLLTATGKMRRAGVAARYADAIDDLYAKVAR